MRITTCDQMIALYDLNIDKKIKTRYDRGGRYVLFDPSDTYTGQL